MGEGGGEVGDVAQHRPGLRADELADLIVVGLQAGGGSGCVLPGAGVGPAGHRHRLGERQLRRRVRHRDCPGRGGLRGGVGRCGRADPGEVGQRGVQGVRWAGRHQFQRWDPDSGPDRGRSGVGSVSAWSAQHHPGQVAQLGDDRVAGDQHGLLFLGRQPGGRRSVREQHRGGPNQPGDLLRVAHWPVPLGEPLPLSLDEVPPAGSVAVSLVVRLGVLGCVALCRTSRATRSSRAARP